MRAGLWLGIIGLCVAVATTAQGQVRYQTIAEGGASEWKHEKSGVVLPGSLLGVERGEVQDATGGKQLDILARYEGEGSEGYATIYLYRPAIMNVPLWFDRSHAMLRMFQKVSTPKAATIFAPPGGKTASAMRVSYAMPDGMAATALALVPVGDWLLKVRLTGPGSAADVEGKIEQILNAIRLPGGPDAPAAVEVKECAEPLQYQQAEALKPDGARVLLVGMRALAMNQDASTQVWCREGAEEIVWSLYRKGGATDGYVLALADSGRVLQTEAIPALEAGKGPDFSLMLADVDQIHQFPQLSALPSQEQVVKFIKELKPVARISRDSRKITLDKSLTERDSGGKQ
ncbi:hypothetical protein [Pedomonas mirosovicensis]|uniref:hypothetical protein n=1 Tax=Pedomonas mirosovicensis TaxID=2908641 RepID=UPI002168A69C|nr:hypothetical protein [Pedomonas mirosovicensis]MCH8685397.1 hypothetical protein [Pedomonas mirosovicensis]